MANPQEKQEETKLTKNAFRVYGALALFVYLLALSYCFTTGRIVEMAFIGIVVLVLGGIVAFVYKRL